MRDFISRLLAKERQEVAKEILGELPINNTDRKFQKTEYDKGRWDAIEELQDLKKKYEI